MSPLRVLSRGYAIAEKEDSSTVKSVDMLSPGDGFCLQLWDGKAQCRVSSVSKRES